MDTRHLKLKGLQEQQRNLKGKIIPNNNQSQMVSLLSAGGVKPSPSLRQNKNSSMIISQKNLKQPLSKTIKTKLLY